MSVRAVTAVGLVCLALAFAVMYVAFAQLYAPAAAAAEAEMRGEPPPISVVSFVWPTQVHSFWWKFFVAAGLLTATAAACLVELARRAVPAPARRRA